MKSINTLFYILLCLFSGTTTAATFNVNSILDDTDFSAGDGVCETGSGNGICTLRAAISEANAQVDHDTINLPANVYNITSTLLINNSITIVGEDKATTIIRGNNTERVFYILTDQTVILDGLTVEQGNAGICGHGGGVLIGSNGNVTLMNMIIRNNQANSGVGVDLSTQTGFLAILDSVIEDNLGITDNNLCPSPQGAGLSLSGGTVHIANTSIRNNTAVFGGEFFLFNTELTLLNSTVSGNTATAPFNYNSGYGGGAFHIGSGSPATLIGINCTISGNRAISNGAGILIVNGTVSLYNCTISNNQADSDGDGDGTGGGIIGDNTPGENFVSVRNSIIAGNKKVGGIPSDCNDTNLSISSDGYNLIGSRNECNFTASTGDILPAVNDTIDPMLGSLNDNGGPTQTHALFVDSPALDAGDPSFCADNLGNPLESDQRGEGRFVDAGSGTARCDMGAYEANTPVYSDIDVSSGSKTGADSPDASTANEEDEDFKLGAQMYYEKRKGGCSFLGPSEFDPMLPLLVIFALVYLLYRRVETR